MEKMSFMAACSRYFGKLPGQTLLQFRDEIAKLTPKDRADLTALFPSVGIEIVAAE